MFLLLWMTFASRSQSTSTFFSLSFSGECTTWLMLTWHDRHARHLWQTFQYDVLVLYKLCMLVSNGLCSTCTCTNLWTSVFCMVCCKSAAAVAASGANTGCSRLGFVTYNLQILNLISFFCFRISPIILNDCATTYIHVHACLPLMLFVSGILYFAVKIHCTINRFIIVVYGQCEKAVSGW